MIPWCRASHRPASPIQAAADPCQERNSRSRVLHGHRTVAVMTLRWRGRGCTIGSAANGKSRLIQAEQGGIIVTRNGHQSDWYCKQSRWCNCRYSFGV